MTHILPNGDLCITADRDERRSIIGEARRDGYIAAEMAVADMLGDSYTFIAPENIGALTDAPILADEPDYGDEHNVDGPGVHPDSCVWWFPNYMIEDPWFTLVKTGKVVFTLAK